MDAPSPARQKNSQATRRIARAAGTVMAAFVAGQLIGLVRTILVARAFGTSWELDAFWAANLVPDTLFNLIAGGALASAFIPVFTGLLAKDERVQAWKLAASLANLVVAALTVAALLAALLAPQIVRYLLASGFADDPLKEALTIDLLRWMLPAAVVFGLSGLLMGILNAHQVFLAPALAPSMYPLGMILGLGLFGRSLGIHSLAVGVLLGASLHLAIQIPALLRLRPRYQLTLGLRTPLVRLVGSLMAPRLFGVAVVRLNFWVNTLIASYLPDGSLAGINYGFQFMMMPQAAIAQSIATASLPTFSEQAALGKLDEMRASLAASLRGVILLSVPASLGLMVLSSPVIALLLQSGVFDAGSTDLVAWALLWYAAGLVGHSVVEITSRAFYALHDTRTPVLVGAAAMALNILFSLGLVTLFNQIGWAPHGGLALANTLATSLEMFALLVLMHRRLKGLDEERIIAALLPASLAGLVMALVLGGWLALFSQAQAWLQAVGGLLCGLGVYALVVWVLRVPEVRWLAAAATRRIRRGN